MIRILLKMRCNSQCFSQTLSSCPNFQILSAVYVAQESRLQIDDDTIGDKGVDAAVKIKWPRVVQIAVNLKTQTIIRGM